ncbi:MAG: hypothetical protein KME09_20520 [Pleurocapsa minor HA4230-MV1]|nr:hypothetical protein [Pleurocapsa minor HA4230-MV1]
MSKDYAKETGYESLLSDFKRYQKETPRGVGMTRKGQNIYLQFKTPNTARKPYACGCTFTLDGMVEALSKSKKVAEALKSLISEVEFWDWYDKEIKQESRLVDDQVTFGEAIAKVEDDFWSRPDRRKRERDRNNPSDQSSLYDTYQRFYKFLPHDKQVNLSDIQKVIERWDKGTKTYKGVTSAMKKLVSLNRRQDIHEELNQINIVQTKFMELQSIDLETFLKWRDETLGITKSLHKNSHLDVRKAWMWVFSTQIVYGLRISEVFAIANLFEPYVTKDKVPIPALNDLNDTKNLIVIADETALGTTTKTGFRIACPQIPPKYPDLMERLDIKNPLLPTNKPKSKSFDTIRKFYCNKAGEQLRRWDAPFTQTHADRNLGNINGMQAGIPLEIRSMSLGHTPAQNDSGYKKRISTQTTIDLLLNSNQNAIDFVTALASVKNLLKAQPENRDFAIELLSVIYQKDSRALSELL